MFWMRAYPLLGQVGGGFGPGILVFLGPQWHSLSARCRFTGPKKLLNSRAQPPPTFPRNGYVRIQNIMHGAVQIIGA